MGNRIANSQAVSKPRYVRAPLSLVAFAGIFSLPAAGQISLGTVVELAQRSSGEVRLAEADLRKAQAMQVEAQAVYIPNLVIGSNIGPPSIGFSFGQPSIASATMQSLAFSYPQRKYVLAAQSGVKAAELNLKDAKEQVALEASTAYIELDTVTREIAVGIEQSKFAARLVEIEEQRQQAGVDPAADLLQARLTAAQLRLNGMRLQSRAATLVAQLVALTGLPAQSIQADHASIPEIPQLRAAQPGVATFGIQAAQAQAASKSLQARGDFLSTRVLPLIGFGAQYNRDATSLGNYNTFFSQKRKFKADNFSAGFQIQIPIFDVAKHARSRESAAEALRATLEAEQAQRQNDIQIATLTGNLQELDALAEVASLKQQIAEEQLKAVQVSLQTGNGAGAQPGALPQQTPKSEQLARIEERQKAIDAIDSSFDLAKARLNLMRALGHMKDWLSELTGAVPTKEPAAAPN